MLVQSPHHHQDLMVCLSLVSSTPLSTHLISAADQGYPESVSDSAFDLGLEKTFEKLTLKGNRFLSTR